MTMRRAFDYAIFPGLVALSIFLAQLLLRHGVPNLLATPAAVSVLTVLIVILERMHPESDHHRRLDQPLFVEAAHFVFSFELGYGIALLLCEGLQRLLGLAPRWPTSWPMPVQIIVALLVYEGTSYWQHRALHAKDRLFRFHALHHSGSRLNFVRAVRFHAVDIGTASFVAYIPLVLLGTQEDVFTILGVLLSALGMLQHANIRMRTPWWLDRLVCTPAVHRLHHSRVRSESDRNFGNTVMLFDMLFGTYGAPDRPAPDEVGIADDPVPRGFIAQVISPFR